MKFKIEVPSGFLPFVFDSKQEAEDYVIGILSWQGVSRYRVVGSNKFVR